MADEPMAYIGQRPMCKAIIMATVDEPRRKKDVARDVAEAIRCGDVIEHVTVAFVQTTGNWGHCHCRDKKPESAQLEMELGA